MALLLMSVAKGLWFMFDTDTMVMVVAMVVVFVVSIFQYFIDGSWREDSNVRWMVDFYGGDVM